MILTPTGVGVHTTLLRIFPPPPRSYMSCYTAQSINKYFWKYIIQEPVDKPSRQEFNWYCSWPCFSHCSWERLGGLLSRWEPWKWRSSSQMPSKHGCMQAEQCSPETAPFFFSPPGMHLQPNDINLTVTSLSSGAAPEVIDAMKPFSWLE